MPTRFVFDLCLYFNPSFVLCFVIVLYLVISTCSMPDLCVHLYTLLVSANIVNSTHAQGSTQMSADEGPTVPEPYIQSTDPNITIYNNKRY